MSLVEYKNKKVVEISISWQKASNGSIPPGAIDAGNSCFVARAEHYGQLIPGRFISGHNCAFISYGGKEISNCHYEILVDSSIISEEGYKWRRTTGGILPENAIVGGMDGHDLLYIARCKVDNATVVGKFYPEHKGSYFPYNGSEFYREAAEILCSITKII